MSGIDEKRAALDCFRALVEAYGAEPRRWPAERRDWALDMLARHAEARAVQAEAARLDGLLEAARPASAPADLIGRVLAAAPTARGVASRDEGWLRRLWRPVLGLAVAAILGIGLGLNVSPFAPNGLLVAQAETETISLGAAMVEDSEL
jgi:hypothetical protein